MNWNSVRLVNANRQICLFMWCVTHAGKCVDFFRYSCLPGNHLEARLKALEERDSKPAEIINVYLIHKCTHEAHLRKKSGGNPCKKYSTPVGEPKSFAGLIATEMQKGPTHYWGGWLAGGPLKIQPSYPW